MLKFLKIELILPVLCPDGDSDERTEFHYNDGTWCAGNLIQRLSNADDHYTAMMEEKGEYIGGLCLCDVTKISVDNDPVKIESAIHLLEYFPDGIEV